MKITVIWTNENGDTEQTKKFADEMSALQWCRAHYKNITAINGFFTFGEPVNHFSLLDYIRKTES